MERPDRAVGLSHASLDEDVVDKDWLIASSQSHYRSTDLRRYQLQWSLSTNNSHPINGHSATYGSCNQQQKQQQKTSKRFHRTNDLSGYALYDNISYADSPLFTKSLTQKSQQDGHLRAVSNQQQAIGAADYNVEEEESVGGSRPGKFRVFLACYLLLGITLAIYSRSTLSLAAVAMLANNQMNTELIALISLAGSSTTTAALHSFNNYSLDSTTKLTIIDKLTMTTKAATKQDIALDGSCPLSAEALHKRSDKSAQSGVELANNLAYLRLPKDLDLSTATREQLELAVKESIRQRVELGQLVDWTPGQQGLIFAAGSLGNLLSAIPITRIGELHGNKWVIFAAITGASLQAALMPLVSPAHVSVVFLFQLIFNGLTYGADCVAYTFFAHWLTPTEMSFFVASLIMCYQSGVIFSNFITSKILAWGYAWSWCFYAPAILCGTWAILWVILGASDPSLSYIISQREQNFLRRRSKIAESAATLEFAEGAESRPVSWLKLAKDTNIWAIIAVKFSLRWHFSVFSSLLPTYLSSITHMSVETIGNLSVFQSSLCLCTGILMSWLTKSIVSKRPFNLSLATVRKIFQSIVNFGLALSMLYFITFDCNKLVTIISLTIGGLCVNFYVAAAVQLPLDLSPHHCGLITSVTNTLALGQALGAPISGLILNSGPKDRSLWRIVWGISIILNTLSGLLFIFLVDSKPKDYNKSILSDNAHPRETSALLASDKSIHKDFPKTDFQRKGTIQFYSR